MSLTRSVRLTRVGRWLSAVLLLATVAPAPLLAADGPLIFAAASVRDGLDAVLAAYQPQGGAAPRVSYAGTPVLARQIEAGAPAELFLSADQQWMDYLQQRQLLAAGTREDLLGNRLVLVSSRVCPQAPFASLDLHTMERWLAADGRLAMAHPQTVPAGRYGKAALQSLALWEPLAGHLVEVENVRLALMLAARGEVPLALVYASDALAEPAVRVCYHFDPRSHPPIRYPLAAVAPTPTPAVAALMAFLSSDRAARIWRRHGFELLSRPAQPTETR